MCKQNYYLFIIVYYYYRYIEVVNLLSLTTEALIKQLKGIFTRHDIPQTIISNNEPDIHPVNLVNFQLI